MNNGAPTNPVLLQIYRLRQDGLTDEQIAEALGLESPADVALIVAANSSARARTTDTALKQQLKRRALEVLGQVLEDDSNPGIQVAAAKILLNDTEELAEGIGVMKFKEYLDQMKKVQDTYEGGPETTKSNKVVKFDSLAMAGAI